MQIPDQRAMWDGKYKAGVDERVRNQVSDFAKEFAGILKAKSRILELGCGSGRDAIFFANLNHVVLATDFSDVVIEKNKQLLQATAVVFKPFDVTSESWQALGTFDAVYSFFSLHYFDNASTDKIFTSIHSVLKPDGLIGFVCKANDPLREMGATKLQDGMFIKDGHIRHFFSIDYTNQLLQGKFEIIKLEKKKLFYVDRETEVIECIARKI